MLQIAGQALHVGDFAVKIVRVLISLAVAKILHETSRRIPKVQRNRFCGGSLDIGLNSSVSGV